MRSNRVVILAGALFAQAALAQDAPPPPAVIVAATVSQNVAQTYSVNGRVDATASIDIHPRVSGPIVNIAVSPGQAVKAGDVLYEIDPALYEAAVQQAKGLMGSAEASLQLAEIERDRQKELVDRQARPQSILDQAEAQLGSSQGSLAQVGAQLQAAELNLSYTRITAPFDGTVGKNNVDLGALVGPEIALTTLTDLDPVHVEFEVPTSVYRSYEESLAAGDIAKGGEVSLKLANGADYKEPGSIDFVSATVSQLTDSVTIRAEFANPDHNLLHDELVQVNLATSSADDVLTIPVSALQRDVVGDYVMVVGDDDTAARRDIKVSRYHDDLVVVGDGLKEGERVITEGANKVTEGVKVDAKTAEEAAKEKEERKAADAPTEGETQSGETGE